MPMGTQVPCSHLVWCGHQVQCTHLQEQCSCVHAYDVSPYGGAMPCRHCNCRYVPLHPYDTVHPYDTMHPFDWAQ
jgi:hypothetical protein